MKRCIFTLIFVLFACSAGFSQQWPNVPGKLEMLIDSITKPIGIQNGIVITSDPALNRVLRNNQVYNSYQAYPGAWNQALRDMYVFECNCNERLLKDTLESGPFYFYVVLINKTVLTGVNDEARSSEWNVYPVPAATRLYFNVQDKIGSAEIMDLTGKQVYKMKGPIESLDISGIKPGQYLLRLTSETKTYQRLILKE